MPTRPDASAASAALRVIADQVEHQRERVASLAEPFLGTEREDVVTAFHEAERQLQVAARALRRAIKMLDG